MDWNLPRNSGPRATSWCVAPFVLTAFFLATGCSKKEPAPPPVKVEKAAGVSIESQGAPETAPSAPASTAPAPTADASAAPSDGPPADRGAATQSESELLDGVYKAYRNYYADKLRYATTMDELVKGGYLKKAPTPPPGKKFVLDAKNFSVYLAPQ